jgi:murein DD-endopeptidase MepM/ murein hydrolase activator NlpD
MKISLFYKSFALKACFTLLLALYVVSTPNKAQAGVISDFVNKIIGTNTQTASADDINTNQSSEVTHNSQTAPILESSSINPDLSGMKDQADDSIDEDEALVSNNTLGPARNLEKYASSAEINVYKVKKGDTLKSIAKKFKVSEDTIRYSNSDLSKSDILKVGQSLVIFPIKSSDKTDSSDKKLANKVKDKVVDTKSDDQPVKKQATVAKVSEPKATKPVVPEVLVPVVEKQPESQVVETPVVATEVAPTTPAGQPSGTISGGYIWPLPAGVGRVSQGLHADQAYDFAAPKGTPIYAPQSGTVLIAHPTGYNGGYGLYVVINFDDGRQAIFGHMSKVVAEAGDVVKQGDIIGYVGSTGHSTGPHVHIGFHGALANPYIGLKVNATDLETND